SANSTGAVPTNAELDRKTRKHDPHRVVYPSATWRSRAVSCRVGAVSARIWLAAIGDDWARAISIRSHPPVSRWQRPSWAIADNVVSDRAEDPADSSAISVGVLRGVPSRLLRQPARSERKNSLAGVDRIFSAGGCADV